MRIVKEIENLFKLLPKKEQVIFTKTFGTDYNKNYNHNQKEILFNLLLWRIKTHQNSKGNQETSFYEYHKF